MHSRKITYHRTSLLALQIALACSALRAADAQAIAIEGGETVTVPGTQGSPWNIDLELIIGRNGDGTLIIANGGIVNKNAGDGHVTLGRIPGAKGTVQVQGAGSQFNIIDRSLVVGPRGEGELSITDGGSVTANGIDIGGSGIHGGGGQGSVTVSGAGSSMSLTGTTQILHVGRNGNGRLDVLDGGNVLFTDPNGFTRIGSAAGMDGQVTVSGAGATLDAGRSLYVGDEGSANVEVSSGGTLRTGSGAFYIGAKAAGTGAVTVSGTGSTIDSAARIYVGDRGEGRAIVEDGGSITSNGAILGGSAGASGSVEMRGIGSQWTNTGAFSVGRSGTGDLTVEDGAHLLSQGGTVGEAAGGQGRATISGAGSKWQSGAAMQVGGNGQGDLTIADGGEVTSDAGEIGSGTGTGNVTIRGDDSAWRVTTSMLVGGNGNADLTIDQGGLLASDGTVELARAGQATVRISGDGSTLSSQGTLIASGGSSSLAVTQGGRIESAAADIGVNAGASSTITLSGAGSQWLNDGALRLGVGGAGQLVLSEEAQLGTQSLLLAEAVGSSGQLSIGGAIGESAAAAGTLSAGGLVFGAGAAGLSFNHLHANYVFDVAMSGASGQGTIDALAGTTRLTADSSAFGGGTTVHSHLIVDGALGGTLTTRNGGLLEGAGRIGDTTILTGGTLRGEQGNLLTMRSLSLEDGAVVDVALGSSGNSALFAIEGNLVLDGILNINDQGGFGAGVYRIMDYAGSLTDNGLEIGSTPGGVDRADLSIQTALANQVNLISAAGLTLSFWDGPNGMNNGAIDGGTGVWDANNSNWTSSSGDINGRWSSAFAVFQGAPGQVTIGSGAGSVSAAGMQFATDGYVLNGATLALSEEESIIRVGNGTFDGIDMVATIDSELAGAATLVKTDYGTLVLNGNNSYSGGTAIRGGVVQISSDRNLGQINSDLTLQGGTLATTADIATARSVHLVGEGGSIDTKVGTTFSLSGEMSGEGSLIKKGDGTLQLQGTGTYTGNTFVESGTLVGSSQNIKGHLVNDGLAVFDQLGDGTFEGDIVGSGEMRKRGAGELTLLGSSNLDWLIEVGDLSSSAERFKGDATIADGAKLRFHQDADSSYGGKIAGEGLLEKDGRGILEMTGNSSEFAGATSVLAGTLRVNGSLGGRLELSDSARLEGAGVVGTTHAYSGSVVAPGSTGDNIGTLTVSGDMTFEEGSILLVGAVLGGDRSSADRMIIEGNLSGAASVAVNNVGGAGAHTENGIRIVQVDGSSNATLTLSGRAVAGNYEYFLYSGGLQSPNDGDWYLRSELPGTPNPCLIDPSLPECDPVGPVLRPEPGAYLANLRAAEMMFRSDYHSRHDGQNHGRGWARVDGNRTSYDVLNRQLDTTGNSQAIHVGMDLLTNESGSGFGVMLASGNATSTTTSHLTEYSARGKVRGEALGVYGTMRARAGDDPYAGLYLDGWVQRQQFRNKVEGAGLATERYDSKAWQGAVEVGYAFRLTGDAARGGLYLEPQVQVGYTDTDSDTHVEANGTIVEAQEAGGMFARAGLRLSGVTRWGGTAAEVQPYLQANWLYNNRDQVLLFDGESVENRIPNTKFEIGAGASIKFKSGLGTWAGLAIQSTSGYRSTSAQLGMSYSW